MLSNKIHKKTFVMAIVLCGFIFVFFWANLEIVRFDRDGLLIMKSIKVKNKICYVNNIDERSHLEKSSALKMIYFVTPTYPRPAQVSDLTRLAHTLMHVPRIHWIIADDQDICSDIVFDILRRSGLPFTHISSPKPFVASTTNFPRGVSNRRAALTWLKKNVQEGILYFGDDDNTVDLQLFDEIRNTKKVSMFPVGLIGGFGVSSPIVNDGKVVAFFDSWPGRRQFPVDMAGFAINIEYLTPTATMPYTVGYEEDKFLISLGLKLTDIEPLASNCSKILVWHTKTEKYEKPSLKVDLDKLSHLPNSENFVNLLRETSRLGMANLNTSNGTRLYFTHDREVVKLSDGKFLTIS